MKHITPLFIYDDLAEPLAFWRDRFGLPVTVELPTDPSKDAAGQDLGFVMFESGTLKLMLQSRASVEFDAPELLGHSIEKTGAALYIEVDDLAATREKAEGCEILFDERETFYGMREFAVRAPGDIVVTFAQPIAKADA